MQIKVFVKGNETVLNLNNSPKVRDLLNALKLEENENLVLKNGALTPFDEDLTERDTIEVVRVVTGG
ncbi:MAG: MoaD/ThiS family protein [Candidatus Thermoplasmatota archaeon]|nr:MoaD/ThiS family protein [Candidatus Thermoplasmatota archaeon]